MSSSLPDAADDVAVSLLEVVLVVLPEGAVLDDCEVLDWGIAEK